MITVNQLKNRINEIASTAKKVDVVKLAKDLGLKVFLAKDGNDFNAEIVYNEEVGEFKILVNEDHPYRRQRFSIAHEIAHFVLHKDLIITAKKVSRAKKDSANYEIEKEADKLAEEILMPESLVYEFSSELGIDKSRELSADKILQFSDRFDVSKTVALIRLRNLGYAVSLSYVAG
jgi:Zn-dependent peptidase ImmA (M78 family)